MPPSTLGKSSWGPGATALAPPRSEEMSLDASSRHCILVAGDDQPIMIAYSVLLIHYFQLQAPSSWDNVSSAHLCFAAGFTSVLLLCSIYIFSV